MNKFPKGTKFKYPWRDYQNRILLGLDSYTADNCLHVIAPPGSGKTVLGLEVALRLNQPTLIIAPTIGIRDQWLERFVELFLQCDNTPDWISLNIRNPKFLTLTTYQGVYAACLPRKNGVDSEQEKNLDECTLDNSTLNNSTLDNSTKVNTDPEEANFIYEGEEDDLYDERDEKQSKKSISSTAFASLVNNLKQQGVKTIVVDEAHHLKNLWWKVLIDIKKELDPTMVALTATPPYDVTGLEWQRYISLCGAIDLEISSPELVKDNDLCPHQDYVYLSQPEQHEIEVIVKHRTAIEEYYQSLLSDQQFLNLFKECAIWVTPEQNLEWIYSNLDTYISIYALIKHHKEEIPEINSDVFGVKIDLSIFKMSYEQMANILNFCISKDRERFIEHEEYLESLERRASRAGIVDNKKISFIGSNKISAALCNSIGKLNSIIEIVKCEHNNLQDKLRMVILTDYIRKEYIVSTTHNTMQINKIGVMPIFEKLRREVKNIKRVAILTGSIVILTKELVEYLISSNTLSNISTKELPYDSNFVQLQLSSQTRGAVLSMVTHCFINGKIEVLIGTKSLLGEGWDAPCINALIMASFVGSFVSSNQMRGRAIRIERGNVEKSGNIWHIACIDPTQREGGCDIDILKRRFSSFVGVSFNENRGIESGISRISIPKDFRDNEIVTQFNSDMLNASCNRHLLQDRWTTAIKSGKSLIEEMKIPYNGKGKSHAAQSSLYLNKTIGSLFGVGVVSFFSLIINNVSRIEDALSFVDYENTYTAIFVITLILLAVAFSRYLTLLIKHKDVSKDIRNIGHSVLEILCKEKKILTPLSDIKLEIYKDIDGSTKCHLTGASSRENLQFLNCIEEIISPIQSPRYILKRYNKSYLLKRSDYHSVPEIIGVKKNIAVSFINSWQTKVGRCDLIYTRNLDGRKALLQARINSLSFGLLEKEEKKEYLDRYNKWC